LLLSIVFGFVGIARGLFDTLLFSLGMVLGSGRVYLCIGGCHTHFAEAFLALRYSPLGEVVKFFARGVTDVIYGIRVSVFKTGSALCGEVFASPPSPEPSTDFIYIGIGKSRASELMQIADGRKTAAEYCR
jgi:hypothetical protein